MNTALFWMSLLQSFATLGAALALVVGMCIFAAVKVDRMFRGQTFRRRME